jgi:uncharacterized membrane protein
MVMGASALLFCACFYYPFAAAYTRAGGYRGQPTLDGTAYLRQEAPEEYGAILWLAEHARAEDVLVEAAGDDYDSSHNRLSAWTGVPTILGWVGHEAQWQGTDDELLRRLPILERIYTNADQGEVLTALRQVHATYLFVGAHEREKHAIDEGRLDWYASFLEPVYAAGGVRLYKVPGA